MFVDGLYFELLAPCCVGRGDFDEVAAVPVACVSGLSSGFGKVAIGVLRCFRMGLGGDGALRLGPCGFAANRLCRGKRSRVLERPRVSVHVVGGCLERVSRVGGLSLPGDDSRRGGSGGVGIFCCCLGGILSVLCAKRCVGGGGGGGRTEEETGW